VRVLHLSQILLLLPVCLSAANSQAFQLGRVSDMAGRWQDNRVVPALPVEIGTYVYNNSKLRRAAHRSSSDFVVIRSSFTHKQEFFRCSAPAVCNDHDTDDQYLEILTRLEEPASPFWRFLTYPSQRWIPTISPPSSGVSSASAGNDADAKYNQLSAENTKDIASIIPTEYARIQDGVVVIRDGRFDLSTVISRLKRSYVLEICSATMKDSCDTEVIDPDMNVGRNATEGTYYLRLVYPRNRRADANGWSSWKLVLAVAQDSYRAASSLYEEAVNVTTDWQDSSATEDTRRAYLAYLGHHLR
jgi:hypothetical protein